jgi:hypothetical protein
MRKLKRIVRCVRINERKQTDSRSLAALRDDKLVDLDFYGLILDHRFV